MANLGEFLIESSGHTVFDPQLGGPQFDWRQFGHDAPQYERSCYA